MVVAARWVDAQKPSQSVGLQAKTRAAIGAPQLEGDGGVEVAMPDPWQRGLRSNPRKTIILEGMLAALVACGTPENLDVAGRDTGGGVLDARPSQSRDAGVPSDGSMDAGAGADGPSAGGPGWTEDDLLQLAREVPSMPQTVGQLAAQTGRTPTFSSGAPFNDLEFTVFDTDYIDGENSGFDVFMPVDPTEPEPGRHEVRYIRPVLISDLDVNYGGARGDRIILGTAELGPFFVDRATGDPGYAVIQQFDYTHGAIELAATASDYSLIYATRDDGVATEGHYLFYVGDDAPDLVAFVFPCDAFAPTISGRPPADRSALCNDSRRLDLDNPAQFWFARPRSREIAIPAAHQMGSAGKEVVGGVAVDEAGNRYLYGLSDGPLGDRRQPVENAVFVTSVAPDGTERWTTTVELANGSMLKDAAVDGEHLYAVGRTLGALPGFENGGSWDGIILKLRLEDGALVASDQFGSPGIDGYGNAALDGKGHLFVSAQGAPTATGGPGGTDRDYLVAKHRTVDLQNVWRVVEPPDDDVLASAEAWGGLTFVPADGERPARLIAAGWFFAAAGADAFVSVYEGLDATQPRRVAYRTIRAPGSSADWVLDNVVDEDGNIYVAGFTTGALPGGAGMQGSGDAFVMKLSAALDVLATVQLGTDQGDFARKIALGPDGDLLVVGSTYGDLYGTNSDPERRSGDVFVVRLNRNLEVQASRQLGTPHEDRSGLAVSSTSIQLGGTTEGSFGDQNRGSFDGWLLELDPQSLQSP